MIRKRITPAGRRLLIGAVFVLLTLTDQLTKSLAAARLAGNAPVVLLPGILELVLVHNTGAAFGLGKGMQGLFALLAAVVCAGLLGFLLLGSAKDGKYGRARDASLVLIAAGAAGNAIDRVRWHYVIDFIYVRAIDFPVFNVADICVTAGCALLILWMIMDR